MLCKTSDPFSINHKKPLLKGPGKLHAICPLNELPSREVSSSPTLIKGWVIFWSLKT